MGFFIKYKIWKILTVVILVAMSFWFFKKENRKPEDKETPPAAPVIELEEIGQPLPKNQPLPIPESNAPETPVKDTLEPEIIAESTAIPQSHIINGIPFTPQAPFANWDADRKEACEEAAVLMIIEWLNGDIGITIGNDGWLNQNQSDQELMKMINWQRENFGGHYDLTIAQVKDFIERYYSGRYQVVVEYDIDIDNIKSQIAQGNPVIVPAAGREMGNRYFQTPGPIYHMTVIIGYDEGNFVTNDPGTKRGQGYRYPQTKLFNSIHDWTGSEETIGSGRKAMMTIKF